MELLIPAALCGIFCYLAAVESAFPGLTLGYYVLGRPLVAGLVCGVIFGDVTQGVLCGVAVQAVFIANLSTGGATNSEITYASYGGIGLAMATTGDPAVAVTLSILIGQSMGLVFYNTCRALWSFFNAGAERAAEAGDTRGITRWHVIYPQIATFFVRAVPVFLVIFFGQGVVDALLASVPEVVTHTIGVLGGVLPALGIGLLMSIILKQNIQLVFFFAGFVLVSFAGLGMIPVVFIAALVAYLVYLADSPKASATTQTAVEVANTNSAFEDDDLF